MATNSSVAGYLAPSSASIEDTALDQILHDAVRDITGLAGDLVRPRWQTEPPQQPDFSVNWCAFGINRREPDVFAYASSSNGSTTVVEQDELLHVLHSFYGPQSSALTARLRRGLAVAQNRDALVAAGLGLVEVQEDTILPALLKEKWVRRVDVNVIYRRRASSTFQVLTITSATGSLVTDSPARTTPINVTNP